VFVCALGRLRESQQMAMTERQSNSAAINQNEPQPNEVEGSHASRHEEDDNSSAKGNSLIIIIFFKIRLYFKTN
jgi:hypothetical protein